MAAYAGSQENIDDLERLAERFAAMGNKKAAQDTLRAMTDPIRDRNQARIKRNVTPSGKKMRERKAPQQGNAHIAFLYETASGHKAIRNLKNYRNLGNKYTGYDRYRGAVRSFLKKRIIRTISIDKRKVITRPSQQKMFKGLIKARWLKAKLTKQEASIYFAGIADQVAAVHHYGEKDKPHPKADPVRYPERQLLAITPEDAKEAEAILIEALLK